MRTRKKFRMSRRYIAHCIYLYGVNAGATNRLHHYWKSIGISDNGYNYVHFNDDEWSV